MRCNHVMLSGKKCKRDVLENKKRCWQHINKRTTKQRGGNDTTYKCELNETNNGGICNDNASKDKLRCYINNNDIKIGKIYGCEKESKDKYNCNNVVKEIAKEKIKYICDSQPMVDSEILWPDERIYIMAQKQHLFKEYVMDEGNPYSVPKQYQNEYLRGHYYFNDGTELLWPSKVIKDWKYNGYMKVQYVNLARYDKSSLLDRFYKGSAELCYCMLQFMLDLPRFSMPLTVYRGLKGEMEAYLKTKNIGYYATEDEINKSKESFIQEKYPIGKIRPINQFFSAGFVINKDDNFLHGKEQQNPIMKEQQSKSTIMLKINLPANFPFFSYYEKPGFLNKITSLVEATEYKGAGLETSEVIIPYTVDRTGNTLTHGMLVKNIVYGAKIQGATIYALIELDVVPLKKPIELADFPGWPSKKDQVGDKIYNALQLGNSTILPSNWIETKQNLSKYLLNTYDWGKDMKKN